MKRSNIEEKVLGYFIIHFSDNDRIIVRVYTRTWLQKALTELIMMGSIIVHGFHGNDALLVKTPENLKKERPKKCWYERASRQSVDGDTRRRFAAYIRMYSYTYRNCMHLNWNQKAYIYMLKCVYKLSLYNRVPAVTLPTD